jgi:RNA polymerase sigma-70 factor (ECF subfamily)
MQALTGYDMIAHFVTGNKNNQDYSYSQRRRDYLPAQNVIEPKIAAVFFRIANAHTLRCRTCKFGRTGNQERRAKKKSAGGVAKRGSLRYVDSMSHYRYIIYGVRERDAQSQMMFYDLFIRSVYRSAYGITGDEREAEEIAQDTMLKVFDRPELLGDDAVAMERMLRRIAVNAAIDAVRRRKGVFISEETFPDCAADDGGEECPADDFSVEEIRAAVAALPESYRDILRLRLFEEASFTEIAATLRINGSTARVRYVRGIAKLKNVLINKKRYDE